MADDVRAFLDNFEWPATWPTAPAQPAAIPPVTARIVDADGTPRTIGERVRSPDGSFYELGEDGQWSQIAAAAAPEPGISQRFAPDIARPFPELPLAVNRNSPIPDPAATLYKAGRDTLVGLGSLPGDVAGWVRGKLAPDAAPFWSEGLADWLRKTYPPADTGHTGTDVMADVLRYGVPGMGVANRVAAGTQGAGALAQGLAQVGAAVATDAAVTRPETDRSIGDLLGAGPTQTEGLSPLGKRAAIGGEAGALSALVESVLAGLGVLKRGGNEALPSGITMRRPDAPTPPPAPLAGPPDAPAPSPPAGATAALPPPAQIRAGEVAAMPDGSFVGKAPAPPKLLTGPVTNVDDLITRIMRREGGFVNDPADRGGKTNFGITERTWREAGNQTPVEAITPNDARRFYRQYLAGAGVEKVPPALREEYADAAVHHGPAGAQKLLRQAMLTSDPEVGFRVARERLMRDIVANDPSQAKFLDGWLKRARTAGADGAPVAKTTADGTEWRGALAPQPAARIPAQDVPGVTAPLPEQATNTPVPVDEPRPPVDRSPDPLDDALDMPPARVADDTQNIPAARSVDAVAQDLARVRADRAALEAESAAADAEATRLRANIARIKMPSAALVARVEESAAAAARVAQDVAAVREEEARMILAMQPEKVAARATAPEVSQVDEPVQIGADTPTPGRPESLPPGQKAPEDMTPEEYLASRGIPENSITKNDRAVKRKALAEHQDIVMAARRRMAEGRRIEVGPAEVVAREGAFKPAAADAGRIRGVPGAATKQVDFPEDRVLTVDDRAPGGGASLESALNSAGARRYQRRPSKSLRATERQIADDLKRQLDELAAEAETAPVTGGKTPLIPVTVKRATGGETKYEIPFEAEKIRSFSKRVTGGGMFYSNPFLNPALIRSVAPELINGATAGIFGHYYDTGQIGFSLPYALAGALATTALMRVPVRGKTVLGPGSHATHVVSKTIPDAMAKTKVGRWFHPTGGVEQSLHDRFMKASREIRDMQDEIAEISTYLRKNFTPAERAIMSDWIEKVDFPGTDAPGGFAAAADRVKEMGDALAGYARDVGEALVDAKMLAKEDFERWRGEYLPRYYMRHEAPGGGPKTYGGKEAVQGRWAKARGAFKELSATVGNRADLKTGDRLVQMVGPDSGTTKYVGGADAAKWEARGYMRGPTWEVAAKQPKDGRVLMWRDYSPAERAHYGEIRDANYRFTKGMMAATHDLAMGKLFTELAGNRQWADVAQRAPDWVHVPDSTVRGTGLRRYGALADMWVHPDVMRSLDYATAPWDRLTGQTANRLMRAYKMALNTWKVGKTAYNPATWFNNFTSNVSMALMAGDINPVDFARGAQALRANGPEVKRARDAGLSIGPGRDARAGDAFAELQAEMAILGADERRGWMRIMAAGLDGFTNNKITRTYSSVDSAFKMASFLKATKGGMSDDEAVKQAHRWYFDYADTPIGAKAIRDFYVPFFSYFYHFAKAFPRLLADRPHGVVAAFSLLSGAAMAAYGKLYPDDPLAREDFEQAVMPRWMQGRGAVGAPKSVRLPFNDRDPRNGEDMAAFLSARYFMPGGDLLDFTNNSGVFSDVWPAVLGGTPLGGNPFINLLVGGATNKDPFFGRAIMQYPEAGIVLGDADAPMWQRAQNAKDLARWASYMMLPPITTTSADKLGNAAVGDGILDADSDLARIMAWTGTDFAGRQRSMERAIASIFGIKIETVSPNDSMGLMRSEELGKIRDAKRSAYSAARDGRLTDDERQERVRAVGDAKRSAVDRLGEVEELRRNAPQSAR